MFLEIYNDCDKTWKIILEIMCTVSVKLDYRLFLCDFRYNLKDTEVETMPAKIIIDTYKTYTIDFE